MRKYPIKFEEISNICYLNHAPSNRLKQDDLRSFTDWCDNSWTTMWMLKNERRLLTFSLRSTSNGASDSSPFATHPAFIIFKLFKLNPNTDCLCSYVRFEIHWFVAPTVKHNDRFESLGIIAIVWLYSLGQDVWNKKSCFLRILIRLCHRNTLLIELSRLHSLQVETKFADEREPFNSKFSCLMHFEKFIRKKISSCYRVGFQLTSWLRYWNFELTSPHCEHLSYLRKQKLWPARNPIGFVVLS